MNNDLKKAMIISAIINSVMFFTEFHKGNYDSYVHMFFADHYRRSWFDTWEPKWYGGFRVTTYPPLSHQLLAILSYIVEMELAYRILTFLTMFLLPISIYYFSKVFVSDRAAGYASIISVFTPSAFIATYIFGQLPTLLSFITTLFTALCLDRFLKEGRKYDLAKALCLLGTSISIHHFTAIFFLPFLIFTIIVTAAIKEKLSFGNVMKRSLQFIISAIVVSAIVIFPFWSFLGSTSMQTPIPHFTRTSILENGKFEASILAMYGGTVVLVPLVILAFHRHRSTMPLFSLVILMSVLGLGGTTVLPQVMFGEVWKWLTYDRFTLWASLTFLPLLGLSLSMLIDALKGKLRERIILYLFLALLISSFSIAYGWWMSSEGFYMRADMQVNLEEIVSFLGTPENWNWRYLTLGFGEASMVKLSILTNATTIDGFYSTGRTLPILTSSGISTLDTAKFYENGFYVLEQVLENASKYSLKWVFCNDQVYEPILKRTGFSAVQTFRNGVTLWEKNDIPRVEYQDSHLTLLDYHWGIMPLLLFMISLYEPLRYLGGLFAAHLRHEKVIPGQAGRDMDGLQEPGAVRDLKRIYETIYNKGLWLHPFLAPSERVKLKVLLRLLNPKISDMVPDLGCGSGRYLLRATNPSHGAWIGLDIAIKPLKKIKRVMSNASVVCADACHLPFRGGTFDKINCIDVLEHIPNDHQALREATKTLKKGGFALFYVPCANPLSLEWLVSKVSNTNFFPRDKEQFHLHRYKTDKIVSLLKIYAFDLLKVTYFLHYFSSFFDLLGSWYDRKSMKGRRPHIPKLFLELIFFIERVEYKVLHSLPFAAGMFILCKKSDAEPTIQSFTTSNAP